MKLIGRLHWDTRSYGFEWVQSYHPSGTPYMVRAFRSLRCGLCCRWSFGCKDHWFCGLCVKCDEECERETQP